MITLPAASVIGAPTRPQGPLKVKDVTKNGAKLQWEKPEDDGGTPITAYVIEKMDMQTGRWVPIGRTQKPEMDVKGLQEGHEYSFRVKAVNDEGESEPLETDSSIIAKNPYGKVSLYFFLIINNNRNEIPIMCFQRSFLIENKIHPLQYSSVTRVIYSSDCIFLFFFYS